ncbi:Acyl-CoA ligase, partial [Lachnellula willkommii]
PTNPLSLDASRPDTHFLTHQSFKTWSQRLGAGLQKAGLEPGDRVLLFSGNSIFFPVAFMGILMAGGIFTGANPGYVARELAYQLKDSEAKFLICADGSLEMGIEAAESIGMSRDRIFRFDDELLEGTGGSRLGVSNWNVLVESEDVGKAFGWYKVQDPREDICCLNYSSGTTGVPKGVMITHFAYVANTTQYAHLRELHPDIAEKNKKAKWLCYLPMYHALAQTVYIAGSLKRGIPVYVMKKFDFVQMLESVQKFKITTLSMVPPIVVALAKSPLPRKYDLSSVVDITCGAAPLSGEVCKEAEALWPKGDVKVEMARVRFPPASAGKSGSKLPTLMKGYWRKPAPTAEIFVDTPSGRWMRTGDIAYVDTEGRFFIVDRMKELIKVKGNQVAPAELEAVLLEHPQLQDACVVGVTIQGEEVPRAYVVPKEGGKVEGQQVAGWVAERVSRFKRLTGGVVLVDAVPKNPSGKILRKILRERAKEEVGDKDAVQAKL